MKSFNSRQRRLSLTDSSTESRTPRLWMSQLRSSASVASSRQPIRCRMGSAGCGVVPLGRPVFGRDGQATDDGFAPDAKHAIEFGDRAGADRMVQFHVLDGFDQPAGFAQQSQPRQEAQQEAEHALDVARGDDPLGISAPGQGDVEQRLIGQGVEKIGQTPAHRRHVAAQGRPQHASGRLFPIVQIAFDVFAAGVAEGLVAVHGRPDHPRGVGGFQPRGDDLFEQRFLDAAAAIVLDQRSNVPRGARMR